MPLHRGRCCSLFSRFGSGATGLLNLLRTSRKAVSSLNVRHRSSNAGRQTPKDLDLSQEESITIAPWCFMLFTRGVIMEYDRFTLTLLSTISLLSSSASTTAASNSDKGISSRRVIEWECDSENCTCGGFDVPDNTVTCNFAPKVASLGSSEHSLLEQRQSSGRFPRWRRSRESVVGVNVQRV